MLLDNDLTSISMDDLEKALILLEGYAQEIPSSMQLKVTQKVMTEKMNALVALRQKPKEFAAKASEFVTSLMPMAPTASSFDIGAPTLHGFLARYLDGADECYESDDDEDEQAEKEKQNAAEDFQAEKNEAFQASSALLSCAY